MDAMKKLSFVACLLMLAPALASTSCGTARGFGQDLQKVGNRIETKADETGGAAPPPAPAPAQPTVPYAY